MIQLDGVTFRGPKVSESHVLARLPSELGALLAEENGFIAFHGGLHVRGLCGEPLWHSLEEAWTEGHALARLYPAIQPSDVPFGEDALGDQYLIRNTSVMRLAAETGQTEDLGVAVPAFLERASQDPIQYLRLEPLYRFRADGGVLAPGRLLFAYPPFSTKEAAGGTVSLKDAPWSQVLRFHAEWAAKVRGLKPGTKLQVKVTR